jgi:hypothetical protein
MEGEGTSEELEVLVKESLIVPVMPNYALF